MINLPGGSSAQPSLRSTGSASCTVIHQRSLLFCYGVRWCVGIQPGGAPSIFPSPPVVDCLGAGPGGCVFSGFLGSPAKWWWVLDHAALVQIPALPLASCMASGMLPNIQASLSSSANRGLWQAEQWPLKMSTPDSSEPANMLSDVAMRT